MLCLFDVSVRMVDAFEDQISSAVENAITKKLQEGMVKINSILQDLPKEIPVDDNASVNVTFVDNPLLTNSSIGFGINGLFAEREKVPVPMDNSWSFQLPVFCRDPAKMLGISLDAAVFKSAAGLYYDVSINSMQLLHN